MRLLTRYHAFAGSYVELKTKSDLEYWRQFIFYSFFIIAYFISFLTLIASLLYAIKIHDFISVGVFSIVLIMAGFLLFNRQISYRIKSYFMPFFLFIIYASTMFFFGPTSDSRLWAFVYVFLAAVFSTLTYSVIATVIVILTDVFFGFFQSISLLQWVEVTFQPLESWYNVSFNFFVLLSIMILITRYLLFGIRELLDRTNKSRIALISGLAKLAEFRDTDTGEHLERISNLAVRLAEEASHLPEYSGYINKEYLSDLAISSLLHDIGKVGIPDNILLKPDKLTEEEYETMKIHPTYGSAVIEEVSVKMGDTDFLIMAAHIAKYHHERWDGGGYPEGLSGHLIPLSARIVALVDVYDSLISGRVYKQPISHKKALHIIKEGSGKQFDPVLTKLFIKIFE